MSGLPRGRLDFSIGPLPRLPLGGEIEAEPLSENVIVPVVRRNHPPAQARSLKELQQSTWMLVGPDSDTIDVVSGNFTDHGPDVPHISVACESFPALIARTSMPHRRAAEIPPIAPSPRYPPDFCKTRRQAGGGGGIRTRDTVARIHALQACAFDHSATPPAPRNGRARLAERAAAAQPRRVRLSAGTRRGRSRRGFSEWRGRSPRGASPG